MVSMLSSSTVDRGFEPRSGQIQTIKLVFVAPLLPLHRLIIYIDGRIL
jgi:hypothetical protein